MRGKVRTVKEEKSSIHAPNHGKQVGPNIDKTGRADEDLLPY